MMVVVAENNDDDADDDDYASLSNAALSRNLVAESVLVSW